MNELTQIYSKEKYLPGPAPNPNSRQKPHWTEGQALLHCSNNKFLETP
jgi:hypothetical protein